MSQVYKIVRLDSHPVIILVYLMLVTFLFSLLIYPSLAQQMPMPVGHYNRGSLDFSWQLPPEGEGYVRLFTGRNRGWATHTMIDVLERTATEMSQLYPLRDRLQVGDLSARKGGKISRHSSHQNGLDVDLAYYRLNGIEQQPNAHRRFVEDMVRRGELSRNFDIQRNWELIKALHRNGKIQRIFVDKAIKRAFCKFTKKIGEHDLNIDVLRSLRPYPHHSNHLHVRLQCPDYAHNCKSQQPPLGGTGC